MLDGPTYAIKAATNLQNDLEGAQCDQAPVLIMARHLEDAYRLGFKKGYDRGVEVQRVVGDNHG